MMKRHPHRIHGSPAVRPSFADALTGGLLRTALLLILVLASSARAATHYVAIASTNPVSPYITWDTAATNIQDAIDVAVSNETVLVSNGVYATGGRAVAAAGSTTNRIAITNAVNVRSVNGPFVTAIQGQVPPGTAMVRCVFSVDNAVLTGFTLTNGFASGSENGGGIYCNSTGANVSNCIITGNSAYNGGGAYQGSLFNCILSGNTSSNYAGGSYVSRLSNCTLSANSAGYGGGGSRNCLIYNCIIFGNSASAVGGGSYGDNLWNCTLVGNTAGTSGGGSQASVLRNCISYFNSAPVGTNDYASILSNCCTTTSGAAGNITNDPALASISHLSVDSPCIGAGSSTYTSGTDIDGEGWSIPPSIGCDEIHFGSSTGAIGLAFTVSATNVVPDRAVYFIAYITGRVTRSVWDFRDGTVVSNRPLISHTFTVPGVYDIALTAVNDSLPSGPTTTVRIVVDPFIHYVRATNPTPVAPFMTWATAATNIQQAIDASWVPGCTVLVSNGVYSTGSTANTNFGASRVFISKPIIVKSANGPSNTVIVGQGPTGTNAIRCVYLVSNAVLSGFTLTNGRTSSVLSNPEGRGGGVYGESTNAIVTNCVISGNSACEGAGSYQAGLYNSTLSGNMASNNGGASKSCILKNCTLKGNFTAGGGGGSYNDALYDCILFGNVANVGGGTSGGTASYCMIFSNTAYYNGGGANFGTLNNCTVYGNSAVDNAGGCYGCTVNDSLIVSNAAKHGGGSNLGTLNRSTLRGNKATIDGGGSFNGQLISCIVSANTAPIGAGTGQCIMYNCTITGNTATQGSGGAYKDNLYNCIIYFNTALSNANWDSASVISNCCTTPMPTNGNANITNDPQFVNTAGSNFHLRASSPCIDAGINYNGQSTEDCEGNPRIVHGRVDMGAYEFQGYWAWTGAITNTLTNVTDCATGDGYPNLLKYATGSSPTNSDGLAAMNGTQTSNGFFALRFNRNTNANDVTLIAESSFNATNDTTWSGLATNINGAWGGATNVSESGTGTPVVVTVQDTTPQSGAATNRFLRLRVTRP